MTLSTLQSFQQISSEVCWNAGNFGMFGCAIVQHGPQSRRSGLGHCARLEVASAPTVRAVARKAFETRDMADSFGLAPAGGYVPLQVRPPARPGHESAESLSSPW